MTVTVAQVAKASLQKIMVQEVEADLEPAQYQDFIFAMNNWMASLETENIVVGYTPVSNLADEMTVPDSLIQAIIWNMAIQSAPEYGGMVTPEIEKQALIGMRAIRRVGQLTQKTKFPSNLPIGSGLNDGGTERTNKFFSGRS